jgi:hypothetical protein
MSRKLRFCVNLARGLGPKLTPLLDERWPDDDTMVQGLLAASNLRRIATMTATQNTVSARAGLAILRLLGRG